MTRVGMIRAVIDLVDGEPVGADLGRVLGEPAADGSVHDRSGSTSAQPPTPGLTAASS